MTIRFLGQSGYIIKTEKAEIQSKIFNKHLPEASNVVVEGCINIDGEDYTYKMVDLIDYLDISIDEVNHTFTIAAINKDLVKYNHFTRCFQSLVCGMYQGCNCITIHNHI